ncbi:peptidase M20 [Cohnella sp. CIP 111063]|nr:peptidase M20 [Cohnella sp. CIP 111063]PRX73589.1 acetylornithine deacetylase/succinyl-diaminopimelate desuccinylase-like protein [Cohnella sp. SGD-V74]
MENRHDPAAILQKLISYNTTNPPGNERECILYIEELLRRSGIESTLLALDANRPNLIARIRGSGQAPPLLLYGHVDVVPTDGQSWNVPPFSGEIYDDCVWGRGALDMKGGVAMLLAAFLEAKSREEELPRDLVLAIVSDEEAGGKYGSKFLVENHAEQFAGIRHAIGEFGGFSFYVGKRKFYPIMVAEKRLCWLQTTIKGSGGHGSQAQNKSAVAMLGDIIRRLRPLRFPAHITSAVRTMIEAMADAMRPPQKRLFRQLLHPGWTSTILKLLGDKGAMLAPLFYNTANITVIQGGLAVNAIPEQIELKIDGRLLPGFEPADLMKELNKVIGYELEYEVLLHDPFPDAVNLELFPTLAAILHEQDPQGVPIPYVLTGSTDSRFYAGLGIQTYGFLPMDLPKSFAFTELIHAANERIPVRALQSGAQAISRLLFR